jgi:hypothetical protein
MIIIMPAIFIDFENDDLHQWHCSVLSESWSHSYVSDKCDERTFVHSLTERAIGRPRYQQPNREVVAKSDIRENDGV